MITRRRVMIGTAAATSTSSFALAQRVLGNELVFTIPQHKGISSIQVRRIRAEVSQVDLFGRKDGQWFMDSSARYNNDGVFHNHHIAYPALFTPGAKDVEVRLVCYAWWGTQQQNVYRSLGESFLDHFNAKFYKDPSDQDLDQNTEVIISYT